MVDSAFASPALAVVVIASMSSIGLALRTRRHSDQLTETDLHRQVLMTQAAGAVAEHHVAMLEAEAEAEAIDVREEIELRDSATIDLTETHDRT